MIAIHCPGCGRPSRVSLSRANEIRCDACGYVGTPAREESTALEAAKTALQQTRVELRQLDDGRRVAFAAVRERVADDRLSVAVAALMTAGTVGVATACMHTCRTSQASSSPRRCRPSRRRSVLCDRRLPCRCPSPPLARPGGAMGRPRRADLRRARVLSRVRGARSISRPLGRSPAVRTAAPTTSWTSPCSRACKGAGTSSSRAWRKP